jgi:hypothetical protein
VPNPLFLRAKSLHIRLMASLVDDATKDALHGRWLDLAQQQSVLWQEALEIDHLLARGETPTWSGDYDRRIIDWQWRLERFNSEVERELQR